jgi:phosphoribosylglycinamide formyltransferase 1
MEKIAIFASGSGTNAQRIIEYFQSNPNIRVAIVLSNNPQAFVLERSQRLGVTSIVFSRHDFYETSKIIDLLNDYQVKFLVLAGFLWLVPDNILKAYPGKILNIHPALLPKYGGKGMYGMKVHAAVIASGEKESGISIHSVNANYDEGQILFQARCKVNLEDTPESLAVKIHALEYEYYPRVIEKVVLDTRHEGPVNCD